MSNSPSSHVRALGLRNDQEDSVELERRWFPHVSLATATATAAATLGVLMGLGGLALMLAVVSTPQPRLQVVTAGALLTVAIVDLRASSGIRLEQRGSILCSALATGALIVYLGVGLSDFGEPFWLHGSYLLLLLALFYRARQRRSIAA
jgi:hypothetical protein